MNQFLDLCGRDRIERRARFVHQDDVRFHRQRASDAKPLLLPAGQTKGAFIQPVFHFVPERSTAQALLHRFIDPRAFVHSGNAQTIGNIFVNRFRKWVRFLKNHSDSPAKIDHIHLGRVNIDPAEVNCAPGNARALDQVIHSIDAAQ